MIDIDKLDRFFNRARIAKNWALATVSNDIFKSGDRIDKYINRVCEPKLETLKKCKAWADANGVHFGEVTDYIEVDNG